MTSDEEQVAPGAPAHWAVMAGQQVRRVGPKFDPTFYGRKLKHLIARRAAKALRVESTEAVLCVAVTAADVHTLSEFPEHRGDVHICQHFY